MKAGFYNTWQDYKVCLDARANKGQRSSFRLCQINSGQRSNVSTACWTSSNMALHSGLISAGLRVIGPQCARTVRSPTPANSTANAGHSFESL